MYILNNYDCKQNPELCTVFKACNVMATKRSHICQLVIDYDIRAFHINSSKQIEGQTNSHACIYYDCEYETIFNIHTCSGVCKLETEFQQTPMAN